MDLDNIHEGNEKQAPGLAAVGKRNPFEIPADYFSEMEQRISGRVAIESLAGRDSSTAFQVPDGYFNSLEDNILTSLKANQLKDTIGNKGYTIPEGYFDSLQSEILEKVNPAVQAEAKIRSITPFWLKYAAAACITVAIGTGIYINQKASKIETRLANISDDVIVDYLLIYSDSGDMPLIVDNLSNITEVDSDLGISEQEIEQYLETTL